MQASTDEINNSLQSLVADMLNVQTRNILNQMPHDPGNGALIAFFIGVITPCTAYRSKPIFTRENRCTRYENRYALTGNGGQS